MERSNAKLSCAFCPVRRDDPEPAMTDPRPTLDAPDDDPRLWLEEVDGAAALAWADAQTALTRAAFAGRSFDADRAEILALLDRPDNLPGIVRRGPHVYNFWRDAAHARGLWRRTTLEDYRREAPDWETLLDLDALAEAEGEDWVWAGAATLPGAHDRAVLSLSRGGGDAAVLREFDLPTRAFVADGFSLPEAKGGADWLDRDTLLLSSALGDATRSGYARTVRLWRRGEAPGPAVFETDAANMAAYGSLDRDAEGRVFFVEQTGFFDSEIWIGDRGGARERLDRPSDVSVQSHRGWLALRPRSAWTVGGSTYAPDTVLGIGFDAFRAGSRAFAVLFEPGGRRALQGFSWCDGRLILSILDDLRPVFDVIEPGQSTHSSLPGLPEVGVVGVGPLDMEETESDGALLASVQDPLTPPSLLLLERGAAAPAVLKRAPAAFDPAGMVVSRHDAVSVDGERIPYVQIGPAGEPDGDAPVHMTGYGGFRISSLPAYRGVIGRMWLARGGTSVIANIRGGGEFGTSWHEAGRREGKALSHEDFAAVAADLVSRGVTRPGRIAAAGGSNGGLLIANMLTRHPEKFGALFCTIPLIDMRRYSKLLAGASWIAEYGDPDVPDDWAFLGAISAYHVARAGQQYPPILIATARRDDRVHPGHARKMAAKLQDLGYDARFYEPAAGGHGYGKDNAETADFIATGHAFMRRAIGWDQSGAAP
jgi:prolyl oligopeptidase